MKVLIFILLLALSSSLVESKRSVGAPSKVNDDQMIEMSRGLLEDHIHKLNLTIVKLIEVQQQIVSGILYKFNGIFKNAKGDFLKCDIDLWLQEWLEDENEKIKISLKNQVKLDDFNENEMLLDGNSSCAASINVFLFLTTIFFLGIVSLQVS